MYLLILQSDSDQGVTKTNAGTLEGSWVPSA